MQASAGYLDPRTKTNASKIVRYLESCTSTAGAARGSGASLAEAASGIGQLSLTTNAAGRTDFSMMSNELAATSNTLTANGQRFIEHYKRGGQGLVVNGSNLMTLCLCTVGPSQLSRGDIFNSREMVDMMNTLVMMSSHFPVAYAMSLPLPGVLGPETIKSLNGKGRAIEWMPSFMCLGTIVLPVIRLGLLMCVA